MRDSTGMPLALPAATVTARCGRSAVTRMDGGMLPGKPREKCFVCGRVIQRPTPHRVDTRDGHSGRHRRCYRMVIDAGTSWTAARGSCDRTGDLAMVTADRWLF